jgi:hypothetical protein
VSITLGGVISGAFLARNLEEEWHGYHQSALDRAAAVGKAWLLDESEGPLNTPIDTRQLIETVAVPVENQYSVTFKIAAVLTDPRSGRPGRPYGWAQEGGWHDRGGGYHEGHHMVRTAVEKAAEAYMAEMVHSNFTLAHKMPRQVLSYESVSGVGANPGLPY